jgi:hypothetical protein
MQPLSGRVAKPMVAAIPTIEASSSADEGVVLD